MTIDLFLEQLKQALYSIDTNEQAQVLAFYREQIEDQRENGYSDDEILATLGDPCQTAQQIIAESGLQPVAETSNKPKLYTAYTDVSELRLNARHCSVQIRRGQDNRVRLHYTQTTGIRFHIIEEQQQLTVTQQTLRRTPQLFRFRKLPPLLIELPEHYDGNLHVETSNAQITAQDCLHLRQCTLHTSNARAECLRCCADFMELHSSNGQISVVDGQFGTLYVQTSNGRLELQQLTIRELLDATTSNGRCEAAAIDCQNCTLKSSNGRLHLRHIHAQNDCCAITSNGAVQVEQIRGHHIYLKSSNAAIQGNISGEPAEYTIQSGTSNGKNNLPSGGNGDKLLEVYTSNSGIYLQFV